MTYRAKMQNGQVVFEGGIKPADGVDLRVEVEPEAATTPHEPEHPETLSELLLSFAGVITDPSLPADSSVNLDHYLYGTPKR